LSRSTRSSVQALAASIISASSGAALRAESLAVRGRMAPTASP
jgi:hypothetical protein